MARHFTQQDILQFYYGELSFQDTADLSEAISVDPKLNDEFSEFVDAITRLDKASLRPSRRVISNIMDFSNRFFEETTS